MSWRGPELRPNGGDSVRYAARDELLIFRRTELRYVSCRWRDLDCDSRSHNIIQRTQRRCKRTN